MPAGMTTNLGEDRPMQIAKQLERKRHSREGAAVNSRRCSLKILSKAPLFLERVCANYVGNILDHGSSRRTQRRASTPSIR